ncbi:MAG: hypothetical protein ACTSUO_10150 [Candidatus Thorarchaeota archaeon]
MDRKKRIHKILSWIGWILAAIGSVVITYLLGVKRESSHIAANSNDTAKRAVDDARKRMRESTDRIRADLDRASTKGQERITRTADDAEATIRDTANSIRARLRRKYGNSSSGSDGSSHSSDEDTPA